MNNRKSISLFTEQSEDSIYVIESLINQYIAAIEKVEQDGVVRVYAGECSPAIYSSKELRKSLHEANEKKNISFRIITGPIISAYVNQGEKYNGILDLLNEPFVTLYRRDTIGLQSHYVIFGQALFSQEDTHNPLESLESRISHESSQYAKISRNISSFEEILENKNVVKVENAWDDLLILSPHENRLLQEACEQEYPDIDFRELRYIQLKAVYDNLVESLFRPPDAWYTSYKKFKKGLYEALEKV